MKIFKYITLIILFSVLIIVEEALAHPPSPSHLADQYALAEKIGQWGLHDSALGLAEYAVSGYRTTRDPGGWIRASLLWANLAAEDPRHVEVLPRLDSVISLAQMIYGDNSMELANAYHAKGMYHFATNCFMDTFLLDSARVYYDWGMDIHVNLSSQPSPELAGKLIDRGNYLQNAGLYQESLRAYLEAFKMYSLFFPEDHLSVANSHAKIGLAYWWMGGYTSGMEHLVSARDMRGRLLGEDHYLVGKSHNSIGFVLAFLGKRKESFASHKRGLEIAKKYRNGRNSLRANCLNGLGISSLKLQDLEASRNYFEEAYALRSALYGKMHRDVAESLNNLGTVYLHLGDFELAIEYLESSVPIWQELEGKNTITLATVYSNIAVFYNEIGDHVTAATKVREGTEIFLANYPRHHPQLIELYLNSAGILENTGDYSRSLDYCKEAERIAKMNFDPDHPVLGKIYLHKGLGFRVLGQIDEARKTWNESLRIAEMHGSAMADVLAASYINLGECEYLEGHYKEAIEKYNLSIDQFSVSDDRINGSLSGLIYKGNTYRALEKWEDALEIHREALERSLDYYGHFHTSTGFCHAEIGVDYMEQGKHQIALEAFQKAISSIVVGFEYDNVYALPKPEGMIDAPKLLELLRRKALCFLRMDTSRERHAEEALQTYQVAARVLDTMRTNYSYGSKVFLNREYLTIYEKGIGCALDLYQARSDPFYLEAAWRFCEQSRSSILLQSLLEARAEEFADLPEEILSKDRKLDALITYYEALCAPQEGEDKLPPDFLRELDGRLFEKRKEKEELVELIRTSYPSYHRLKYDLATLSLLEVQSRLEDSTTMIEYFYGDSSIFMFAITRDTVMVNRFEKTSDFEKDVKEVIQRVADVEGIKDGTATSPKACAQYTAVAHRVYEKLLAPILEKVPSNRNIIIVPDGLLSYLPFEVLISDPAHEPTDYASLPYIIKHYVVSYDWSARIHFEELNLASQDSGDQTYDMLVVAPSYLEVNPDSARVPSLSDRFLDVRKLDLVSRLRGEKHLPLTYSIEEAKVLEDRFNAFILLDSQATESVFLQEAPKAKVIHIGAHGSLDPEEPEYSHIAFQEPFEADPMKIDDGYLHINEIYNMDLNAELVVLPVCNSGSGEIQRGEGLLSMARSFRYAGCPSVVASQWEIDDRSGMGISINFYDCLSQGYPRVEALRVAKLKQLEEGGLDRSHPFFWASMVLIGERREIEWSGGDPRQYFIYLVIGGVILTLGGILLRKLL